MRAPSDARVRPATWFIGGTVRSGSTVLAGLLTEALGGFNAGEVQTFWRSRALGRLCTCGEKLDACAVWGPVAEQVVSQMGRADFAAIEATLPRIRQVALRGWNAAVTADYLRLHRLTDAAIREVTGASVVIDATKAPGAAVVARATGHVQIVHLVRDPRAVAFSQGRPKRDPSLGGALMPSAGAARSAAEWIATHGAFEKLGRSFEDLQRVRYEDFVTFPSETLSPLLGVVALPSAPVSDGGDHSIAGNPWRFDPARPLSIDDGWQRDMLARKRIAVDLMTWRARARYDYTGW